MFAIRYTDLATTLATADAIASAAGMSCMVVLDYFQGAARDPNLDRRLAVGAVIQAITEWSESRGNVSARRVEYRARVVHSSARRSCIPTTE